jgi:hypothetical protein
MAHRAQKVGGEYGDIRANIDVKQLDIYLQEHLEGYKSPLTVKQFKARFRASTTCIVADMSCSLDRYK